MKNSNKMDKRLLFMILMFSIVLETTHGQHEDIPYENIENICKTCTCLTAQETDKRYHHSLSCASKKFKHILAHWPEDFGKNHNGVAITATFSNNNIEILQQIPATNATLTFSCSYCGIKHLQAPTFMDVPNIERLDLSWNSLTTDELTVDVFRGPYRTTHYEPIGLEELDLSHNALYSLDRKVFEHTPNLRKLNLSFNKLKTFDYQLVMALTTVPKLEDLDLSYTGIGVFDVRIFKALKNLKRLNLAGNNFTKPPMDLKIVGDTLESLNLAQNPITQLDEQSFAGLNALKRLNISYLKELKTISNKTFEHLKSLERLYLTNCPHIEQLDMDSLMECKNLTQLDMSHGGFSTLKINSNATQRPWSKLRSFELGDNPWLCDCDLLTTLELVGGDMPLQYNLEDARCMTPPKFSGAVVLTLNASEICSLHIPKQYRVVDEDPPRFLRKRYIILTLITASVVIGLGLVIGFIVSCLRRRLKREEFGVEPIRYTSVRCSNLSAFSNANHNGRNSGRINA